MTIYIDSLILFLFGIFLFPLKQYTPPYMTGALLLLALFCFLSAGKHPFIKPLCGVLSGIISLLLPELSLFLPLICYPYFYEGNYKIPAMYLIPLGSYFISDTTSRNPLLLLVLILSLYLGYQTRNQERLQKSIYTLRDDSVEQEIQLKKQNRSILEHQDNQIYVATLQERNRIAREIHDNVGHMLSRSILQVGALLAICKDETLRIHLSTLKDTLDTAMNSIRNSVHDLHDESVDLKQAVENLSKDFTFCEISLDFDISPHIPRDVKYSFLAIIKEALNNTMKHSNASKISLMIKEHPGFYQLLIEDNGTNSSPLSNTGIGLTNMKERIDSLGGIIHFNTDKGFRIFISVPKQNLDTTSH